jgi:hypothetical protein
MPQMRIFMEPKMGADAIKIIIGSNESLFSAYENTHYRGGIELTLVKKMLV